MEKDENLESLEYVEFEHIKNTANLIKRDKKIIEKVILEGDIEKLEKVSKDLEEAIKNLEKFTNLMNKQHDIILELKKKTDFVSKRL